MRQNVIDSSNELDLGALNPGACENGAMPPEINFLFREFPLQQQMDPGSEGLVVGGYGVVSLESAGHIYININKLI